MARRTVSEHHARLIADTAKYEAGMTRAVAATKAAESKIGSSGRGMGATFQNVGYQVQDFAVQVAGGTSAMRAFGQQAPQMLGAFGPAGAVAGAVVSVGALIAQIVMATKETKAASVAADKMAGAFRGLFLAREKYNFDMLPPELKAQSLDVDMSKAESEIRMYRSSLEAVSSKIREITVASPTGAFAVKLGKGDEYEELAKKRSEIETRIAEIEKEKLSTARQRMEIEQSIAATIERSALAQVHMAQQAKRNRIEFESTLSKSLANVTSRLESDTVNLMASEVSAALEEIYGGAARIQQAQGPLMPEIPANSYQRRGLSLDADGGGRAGETADSLRHLIKVSEKMEQHLAAARRSGVITWQTN
jgi:hypothetical protein